MSQNFHVENLKENCFYEVNYRTSRGKEEQFLGKFLGLSNSHGILWTDWSVLSDRGRFKTSFEPACLISCVEKK